LSSSVRPDVYLVHQITLFSLIFIQRCLPASGGGVNEDFWLMRLIICWCCKVLRGILSGLFPGGDDRCIVGCPLQVRMPFVDFSSAWCGSHGSLGLLSARWAELCGLLCVYSACGSVAVGNDVASIRGLMESSLVRCWFLLLVCVVFSHIFWLREPAFSVSQC